VDKVRLTFSVLGRDGDRVDVDGQAAFGRLDEFVKAFGLTEVLLGLLDLTGAFRLQS
jgi:hypothetical protein